MGIDRKNLSFIAVENILRPKKKKNGHFFYMH